MKTTTEKIHEEFDTAAEKLVAISQERERIAESTKIPQEETDYEDGKFLKSMGFSNSVLAKKAAEFETSKNLVTSDKTQNVEIAKKINTVVQKYHTLFPFHKFILYSQVIKICEKYNLYLAPAKFFQGEIPAKNIEEMKNFPWDNLKDQKFGLSNSEPVFNQINTTKYNSISNYICAPLNDFNKERATTVGREIFEKPQIEKEIGLRTFKYERPIKQPKDPIILVPVTVSPLDEIGFIVVTKWGIEANDTELQVGLNN